MYVSDRHGLSPDAQVRVPVRDRELSVVQSRATEPGPMTRYRRRPSGLLVPDHEVRGFRPSAFGGRGGVFRSRGPGNVMTVGGDAPTVTSISPTSGGREVPFTIIGANFVAGGVFDIKFDAAGTNVSAPTAAVVNSTTIRGTAPDHADGAVTVTVITDNGSSAPFSSFTFADEGEPFSDDVGVANLINETFEGYTNTADFLSDGTWTIETNPGGDKIVIDTGEFHTGTQCLRFDLPAGMPSALSPHIIRQLSTHSDSYVITNVQVWMRAMSDWQNGKGIIMLSSNQGNARPCGGQYYRYQFGLNKSTFEEWGQNYSYPKLAPKGEDDSVEGGGCAGPITEAYRQTTNSYGAFVWDGAPTTRTPPPLVSTDPAISGVPWTAFDDGQWHRITISIKQNPSGYLKMWIDGYLVYDSTGNYGYASRPTDFQWEWLAANGRTTSPSIYVDDHAFWQSN